MHPNTIHAALVHLIGKHAIDKLVPNLEHLVTTDSFISDCNIPEVTILPILKEAIERRRCKIS